MATVNFLGFETGVVPTTADNVLSVSNSGNLSVVSSPVLGGTYALRVQCTTSATTYVEMGPIGADGQTTSNINKRDSWIKIKFRYATKPAAGDEPFIEFRSTSAKKASLALDLNGKLVYRNSAGTSIATGSTTLAANTNYEIWVFITNGAGTGIFACYIDGVAEIRQASQQVLGANLGVVRIGKPFNQNSQTVDWYLDDLVIEDSMFPRRGNGIYTLLPAANTTDTGFNAGTHSSDFNEIKEVANDGDTTYIATNTAAGTSTFTLASTASLPAGGQINSLKISVVCRRTSAAAAVRVRSDMSGTVVETAALNVGTTYTTIELIQELNPVTQKRWTYADLATLKVGIREQSTNSVRCTQIRVSLNISTADTLYPTAQKKAGFFTVTGAGFTDVTGLGFRPRVIFIFGLYTPATGDSRNSTYRHLINVVDGNYGKRLDVADDRPDNQPTSSYGSNYVFNDVIMHSRSDATTTQTLSQMLNVHDDGFSLSTEVQTASFRWAYLALGGDALDCDMGEFTTAASTGSQAFTPLRFQSDLVLFIGNTNTGNIENSLGMAIDSSHQWATVSHGATSSGTSVEKSLQRADRSLLRISPTLSCDANFTSMDARGFTLNFNTASATKTFTAVGLKGILPKLGSLTQPTSTGSQSVGSLGMQPQLVLLAGASAAQSTSIQADGHRNIGFAVDDGTPTQWGLANSAKDNDPSSNTQTDNYPTETKMYPALVAGNPGTLGAIAQFTSFDSGGFTVNWTTADATAREVLYMLLGIKEAPTVTTTSASSITGTSASTGGNVTSAHYGTVSARGVVYATHSGPTLADSSTSDGTGTGSYSSSLSGLTANTTYYVKAYATNEIGTNYGSEISFTTNTAPTVTTTSVSSITGSTASTGGNVTSDGGGTVSARGVAYDTSPTPTISGSHTSDGTGTGSFSSSLSGLTPNTLYYVRAYATNAVGTSYGSQTSFTTATTPTVTTTSASSVTALTASTGGNVTADGGQTVTARGVAYGTSASPTISGSHTSDGSGTGSFSSSLSGLTPNTLYYVRAYATNSVGTAYGSQVTFTTATTPTVTTTSISSITSTTANTGGNATSDGGDAITAKGVAYGTSTSPTVSGSHTTDGTGTGSFTSNLTGLTAATTYYVRAYATNPAGTAYGSEVSFTTLNPPSNGRGRMLLMGVG